MPPRNAVRSGMPRLAFRGPDPRLVFSRSLSAPPMRFASAPAERIASGRREGRRGSPGRGVRLVFDGGAPTRELQATNSDR